MNKTGWIIFSAVVVLFLGGLIALNKMNQANLPQSDGSNNVYGNVESKVTLTEFIDFQCEACYAYYPTVKELKEKYKDTVKFEVKNFPISSGHQFARMAAAYGEAAAKQGKFWEMHDKIFEGQKTWERGGADTYFKQYAEDIGDASHDEQLRLLEWKLYSVELNRIEKLPGFPEQITWPIAPGTTVDS